MKTPREILLAKHQAADTKLDKIRRAVIGELNNEGTEEQSFVAWLLRCSQNFWRELILPRPQAWAAVAALWILIFALKLSTQDPSPVAAKKTSLSPEVFAELKEQKAFFGELAGLPPLSEAKPPKELPPRPRSARNPEFSRA
jgi:hypothetical protein